MKVTFDKNVYEFVVDPGKDGILPRAEKQIFESIHQAIIDKRIEPFISETILTYESVNKEARQKTLSHNNPLNITGAGGKITIASNPSVHPGSHPKNELYLRKAVELGFRILPGKRFGKLVNPIVQPEWFYLPEGDYMQRSEHFSEITKFIQSYGCGYAVYNDLTCPPELAHLNFPQRMQYYTGGDKKLSRAIAEWSDGDSVALHLTYGIHIFCSKDEGRNAGTKSVFHPDVVQRLDERYGFKKVSPAELQEILRVH